MLTLTQEQVQQIISSGGEVEEIFVYGPGKYIPMRRLREPGGIVGVNVIIRDNTGRISDDYFVDVKDILTK